MLKVLGNEGDKYLGMSEADIVMHEEVKEVAESMCQKGQEVSEVKT